jgi:hypothetical protein
MPKSKKQAGEAQPKKPVKTEVSPDNPSQAVARLRKPFRKQKKQDVVRPERARVSAAPRLFIKSLVVLKGRWKLFLPILGFYALAEFLLVGGISGGGLAATKAALDQTNVSVLSRGATLFSSVISSSGNTSNASAGAYQTILVLLMSVVVIWALRQVTAGHNIRARDAFYKGMYPLIPFMLVLLLVGVELLPVIIGGQLYGLLMNGIAIGPAQKALAVGIFAGAAVLSLYWLCSSLIALYIVTLPDMTPMQAIRSARELVRYRRWVIVRKILFLPFVVLLLGVAIMVPLAQYLTPLAPLAFFCLAILALPVVHSYMYALYKELL